MGIDIYTDGGSLNNPGEAAYAYIIYQNNKIIFKDNKRIGIASNNFAEYTALIKALEKVKELLNNTTTLCSNVVKINLYSDSALMVNQLNGFFKVKHANMRDFVIKARILESEIKIPIKYVNIPREKNTEADKLVKQALEVK